MMRKEVVRDKEKPPTILSAQSTLHKDCDPVAREDLARSFLGFAKQHMECTNREAGSAVYNQSLDEVNHALGDLSTYLSGLDQPKEEQLRDFDKDPNIELPEYRSAKETYDKYVRMVDAGEYEELGQMIALFSALLKTVPKNSLLAKRIWEEIDDLESDRIADGL